MWAELSRLIENMIRIGTIADADHANQMVRVTSGDLTTDWLPWPAEIGRNFIRWRPLRTDAQVVLACPSGDPAQAVIVAMLYRDTLPPPSTSPTVDRIQFDDGSYVEHNADDGSLSIHATGQLTLSSNSQLTLQAPAHHIIGPVTQNGGDMTSDGISAQHHTHGGVIKGGDQTDEPAGASS